MSDHIGKVLEKDEILRLQKEKLHENPGHEKEDIEAIRKWIKQQPHLKNYGKTGKLSKKSFIPMLLALENIVNFM